MQTKHQIQYLLESEGISPDKRLGQHFLIDLNLMRLLIEAAQIGSDDVVLEVGCGTGSLTQGLSERGGEVIAVEIDENLTRIAKGQLADKKNVEIINTDVLETFPHCFRQLIDSERADICARGTSSGCCRKSRSDQSSYLAVLA